MPSLLEEQYNPFSSFRMEFVRFAQGTTWLSGYRLSEAWFKKALIDFTYWFIYKGQGELTDLDTGITYPMHAGVCVLMRPGMRFTAAQVGEQGLGNLYFHVRLLRNDGSELPLEEWPDLPIQTEVLDFDYFHMASRRLLTLFKCFKDADYPAQEEAGHAAEQLFKTILLDLRHLHRVPKSGSTALHHQRAIQKALRALDESPRMFTSVEEWAATSGYSVSHFRTLCLRFTGKSPLEQLIHARIHQAKEYLRYSSLTIGMIASQLGYENTHYFSRQFRKQTGMTATEFRESTTHPSNPPRA